MENRPNGIIIIAIIMLFASFMAFIVSISTFIQGTPLDVVMDNKYYFPQDFKNSIWGVIFCIFISVIGITTLSRGRIKLY
jgi:tellurite resistance protein TehA-like permease